MGQPDHLLGMEGLTRVVIDGDRVVRYTGRLFVEGMPDYLVPHVAAYQKADFKLTLHFGAMGIAPPVLDGDVNSSEIDGIVYRNRIVMRRGVPLEEATFNRDRVFRLLSEKVSYLQARRFHHRDLHSGNVVLIGGEPFIIDWELAVSWNRKSSYDLCGPVSGVSVPAAHGRATPIWWGYGGPRDLAHILDGFPSFD